MSILGDIAYALIQQNSRAIGTIFPDVVVEESARDDLVITDHPVEVGAAISDHAFRRPAEVEMRCGFSNSTVGSQGYAETMYAALLALQREREPFSVSTGKRRYRNMLIRSLSQTTDEKTENVLMITVGLREVLITSTQSGTGAEPDQGTKQPTLADQGRAGKVTVSLGSASGGAVNATSSGIYAGAN